MKSFRLLAIPFTLVALHGCGGGGGSSSSANGSSSDQPSALEAAEERPIDAKSLQMRKIPWRTTIVNPWSTTTPSTGTTTTTPSTGTTTTPPSTGTTTTPPPTGTTTSTPSTPTAGTPTPTFVETFDKGSLDPAKWTVSTWGAPGSSAANKGSFLASNVDLSQGMLRLKLQQSLSNGVFTSTGGEIATTAKFGYGTYEMVVRPSTVAATPDAAGDTVSGGITGLFSYLPGSATEIDWEVETHPDRKNIWYGSSWTSESTHTFVQANVSNAASQFWKLKWVWSPGKIDYYVNDQFVGSNTQYVPTQAANFMINHWGTNNVNWGGYGTANVERYVYVKYFAFTAAQ